MNPDVTNILNAIGRGEAQAAEQLLPLVYHELRELAKQKLSLERPGQTMDATGLVHEVYLRLVNEQGFENRRHFFGAAAVAMRRILVERARRRMRIKHGGEHRREHFDADLIEAAADDENILALDRALERLAEVHPTKAQLVQLRFFGGLTGDEAAEALGISPSTADRDWVFARAWLRREMEQE
jgi:RNA polymerase sigma factor (TIGR02999 family)